MPFNQPRHSDRVSPRPSVSWLILLPALALLSNQTFAHDDGPQVKTPPPEQHGWSGNGKLGLDANAGNTNTRKIKGAAKIVYNQDFNPEQPFRHNFGVSVNKGSNAPSRDGVRTDTTDKESANYRLDYFLSDRSSARAFAFYLSDKKAKIDSFTMVGVGYEYDLFKTDRHNFNIGGGISNLKLEYNDGTPAIEGPAGRVALSYNGRITDKFSLDQTFVYLGSEDLTMKSSNTSLSYAFTPKTAISLDHEITNYSSIANTAIDDTDDSTSLNVVFKF